MRQLDIVLELRPPINHHHPFAELDTLYTHILTCTESLDLVLRILGLYDVLLKYYDLDKVAFDFIESAWFGKWGRLHLPQPSQLPSRSTGVQWLP